MGESSLCIYMSFLVPPETSDKQMSLQILANVLGGGSSGSRLFQSISQRKGLAYGIGSVYNGTKNVGFIEISGKVDAVRYEEVIDNIFEEMDRLKKEPVPEDELNRVKRNGRYGVGKFLEQNIGQIQSIQVRKDRGVTPEKLLETAQNHLPSRNGKYVMLIRIHLKIKKRGKKSSYKSNSIPKSFVVFLASLTSSTFPIM